MAMQDLMNNETPGLLDLLTNGITKNPGLDAMGRTFDNAKNYLTSGTSTAGYNNSQTKNQEFMANTPFTKQPGINYTGQAVSQPAPTVLPTVYGTNKPIMDNSQQVFQNPNQTGQNKYQYNGPIQTLFGSANFGNGNNQSQGNFNTNTGDLMGNYKFNQDNYNQDLRNTANQNVSNLDTQWRERTNNMLTGSIGDMLTMSMQGNQDRQMMRKNQADFTNANNLASKNLEQQNQLGLQDLMSQRTTDLSQQNINNAQENQGVDNQYKYDYMDKYLLPQMRQQDANQRANLDLQQQMHSGDIFKSSLIQDAYKSLQPSQEILNSARQNIMGSEMGKIWKNQLDNKLGGMTNEKYNELINNSANQELGKEAQAKINYLNLISGNNNNSKQYGTEETKVILPDGTEKTTKIPLTSNNSNSVAKTTGKVFYDPKTGVTINN